MAICIGHSSDFCVLVLPCIKAIPFFDAIMEALLTGHHRSMPWFPLMILLLFPRKVLLPSSITSHHVRSNFDLAIPMHHISGGRFLRFSEQTAGPAIPSASTDASVSLDGILMRFSEDVHGVSLIQFHTMIRFRTSFCRSKIDTSKSTAVDVSCIHIGSRKK